MTEKILVGLSLSTYLIGTYLIWFNKKNIFNHMSIGLCVVAYVIPIFVLNFENYSNAEIWALYAKINIIGCISFIGGLILGYKWKNLTVVDNVIKFQFLKTLYFDDERINKIIRISNRIFLIGIIGVIISYMAMGFIPLFSENPYMAKFFKGQYQAPYQRVAFIYRTARQLIEFLMPLKILEIFLNKKLKDIILVLVAIILIVLSLNRGAVALGVLTAISIIVALKKSNLPFWTFLVLVFITFSVGSGIVYIIGYFFPNLSGLEGIATGDNFFEAIALGAPDIPDQLGFLSAFLNSGAHYTYGLTFIGGLIPFNFEWNPGIYTLRILNETKDVSEISSGGLRLSPALWGYVSFGWFGVVFLPFFTAFFSGYIIRKMKIILNNLAANRNGYVVFFMVYFMFSSTAQLFTTFYSISIYWLPSFFIFYLLLRVKRKKILTST
ncbi:O-antigen polymerase [Pedobacter sp. N23S346]|uniref:O-antigen polymerase n=1 Tax=Pedobacter sp. N23S346 TaxID=3402750 RepID=UPI003AD3682C